MELDPGSQGVVAASADGWMSIRFGQEICGDLATAERREWRGR
jgi:hypothetical protein